MDMTRDVPMPHPGVVLREEFLEPMGLSVYALAKAIRVTRSQINEVATVGKESPRILHYASAVSSRSIHNGS